MVSLLARLPRRGRDGRRGSSLPPSWLAAAAVGAAAAVSLAGLAGLTLALVVVQTLDPAGGFGVGSSITLAGRLWLLAQGAELDIGSGPLILAPLLLTLAAAWGLVQAGRGITRLCDEEAPRSAVRAGGVVVVMHVLVSALIGLLVDAPDARVGLLRTVVGATALSLACVGWGVGRESGLLDSALDRLPVNTRPMLRGVLAGLLAAMALCTTVVAVALVSDARGYATLSGSLGGAAAGGLGLLGLALLLLPNAAAAVLGLAAGPGFSVGAGTLVSVHGVTLGAVPALPLLAALPDTQAVPLVAFASQVIPVLSGLVVGTTVGRWAADGGSVVAGLTGLLGGVLLGVAGGALVWIAGGSLGDGSLAQVGAPALATGVALAAQCGIAAAVAAAVARWRALG
ncbi:MAG: conserved rane protein of unknown function [Blastococcus sp.]|nr:conserved rane protein of unknown function [Blastococcus sp.]